MLSSQTIERVKSTAPLLQSAGTAVTEHFYRRMFTHNPELKHIFNMSNQASGKQHFALFNALAAYANNIDNLDVLQGAVSRINQKHVSLNIQAEHYDIVGQHLIATLKELVPNEFTPEIEQAWREAYGVLAAIFINQESELYTNASEQKGGWRDWREFVITRIEKESQHVKSFYLTPKDGQAVARYQGGQFIALRCTPEGSQYNQIRQYSLSQHAHDDHYRISVKKQGLVSSHLHTLNEGDTLNLLPPAGDFVLQNTAAPKVFISAGVGVTPMMSMLQTQLKENPNADVSFLHACIDDTQHNFKADINALMAQHSQLKVATWYEHSEGADYQGRMDLTQSMLALPFEQGEFYLCGPTAFMVNVRQQLVQLGVQDERIFYEVFGPHEGL